MFWDGMTVLSCRINHITNTRGDKGGRVVPFFSVCSQETQISGTEGGKIELVLWLRLLCLPFNSQT